MPVSDGTPGSTGAALDQLLEDLHVYGIALSDTGGSA